MTCFRAWLAARAVARQERHVARTLAIVAASSGWMSVDKIAGTDQARSSALSDALAELEQRGHVASRLERYRWPVERLPRRIWWATPAGRRASAAHDGHGNFNARKAFPAIFHPPRM